MESKGIAYSASHPDDPLRQFDVYHAPDVQPEPTTAEEKRRPVLCFIHGGAWGADDKQAHTALARTLASSTLSTVLVPNYRLTPQKNSDPAFHHPMHVTDVREFLRFVVRSQEYAGRELVVIGHSCSAHMLACVFLDDGSGEGEGEGDNDADVYSAVKALVLSEGIYDLDTLLATFPDYAGWFIHSAFGPPPAPSQSYKHISATHFPLRPLTKHIHWLLLHSKADTLVNTEQTLAMAEHLRALLGPECVKTNTDELDAEHDETLLTEKYITIVNQFISQVI